MQITITRITLYIPCSNGKVICYNCTLIQLIRCFLNHHQKSWHQHLEQLAGMICSTMNQSTGFTPNMMMLVIEVLLPVDLMLRDVKEKMNINSAEYVVKLRSVLHKSAYFSPQNITTQMRQKRDYKLKLKIHLYEVGDLVGWL